MYDFLHPRDGAVVDGMETEEVVYAKDQPEYIPLRTLRSKTGIVLSRWSFTDEQRKAIASGADIFLELHTFNHPLQPIRVAVSDGKLDNDWIRVCVFNESAKESKVN